MRALVLVCLLLAPAVAQDRTEAPLLKAMQAELDRSFEKLRAAGDAPLYFIAYRVYDVEEIDISSSYGALDAHRQGSRQRSLDVEVRVGSPKLDNTHKIRSGGGFSLDDFDFGGLASPMPVEDDEAAIRSILWLETDRKFKDAQKKFTKVKANKAVKVEEEDTSDDFSVEKPQMHLGAPADFRVDRAEWEQKLRRISASFRDYAHVHSSSVTFSASRTRRYCITSEGTKIQDERVQLRFFIVASTTADDGMKLWLYDGIEVQKPADIPDEKKLEEKARALATELKTLRDAPVADTFAGPAILRSRAAGVFFHEIFGHRIEGHRQKDEGEGRTFAKKVGQSIMPEFITVTDDPTRAKLGDTPLNGHYAFDDEGVPAQKVTLVEKGMLNGFLMGRSPVKNFPASNGHGRCSPGRAPVARQGNLIVDSSKRVPFADLKKMLIEEVKRQGKPYGLIFDDIAGGFTMTQTFMPQSFKLLPLRVWRVFPDGKEEVLRGVDLVGTPLASLERIVCAADDDDVFNGTCGAESGWVPVSACSPSLLVATIEVERQSKGQDKPPLLSAPKHDTTESAPPPPKKEDKP
jgi:predicted Zn-dependent protease